MLFSDNAAFGGQGNVAYTALKPIRTRLAHSNSLPQSHMSPAHTKSSHQSSGVRLITSRSLPHHNTSKHSGTTSKHQHSHHHNHGHLGHHGRQSSSCKSSSRGLSGQLLGGPGAPPPPPLTGGKTPRASSRSVRFDSPDSSRCSTARSFAASPGRRERSRGSSYGSGALTPTRAVSMSPVARVARAVLDSFSPSMGRQSSRTRSQRGASEHSDGGDTVTTSSAQLPTGSKSGNSTKSAKAIRVAAMQQEKAINDHLRRAALMAHDMQRLRQVRFSH